jgi:hypothetical protein
MLAHSVRQAGLPCKIGDSQKMTETKQILQEFIHASRITCTTYSMNKLSYVHLNSPQRTTAYDRIQM